jgi:hypothetical protein
MTGFADVVAVLVAHLDPLLPAKVATRVPHRRPVEFIQIRRVGGAALPPVRELVRIDVLAWAKSEVRAAQLGRYTREAIWALAGTTIADLPIYQVGEFLGPTMIDDDETGIPQSWATYELMVRAEPAIHGAP